MSVGHTRALNFGNSLGRAVSLATAVAREITYTWQDVWPNVDVRTAYSLSKLANTNIV